MNENPAVIEALFNAGADLSARDADGLPPLHVAARSNNNPAVIEALLNAGADLSARDANGWTSPGCGDLVQRGSGRDSSVAGGRGPIRKRETKTEQVRYLPIKTIPRSLQIGIGSLLIA